MKLLVFLGLFFILLLSGCSKENNIISPSNNESGSLVLKIDRQNKPQNVISLKAALTRTNFNTLVQTMNLLSDSTADVSFNNIAVGVWHLKVDAYDSTETIVYTGETDINVLSGTTVQVNLTLIPTASGYGNIYIMVTWGLGSSSWQIIPSGTSSNLQSVFFIDPLNGWTVGENGKILKSTDGGNTWTAQSSGTTQRINWIHFLDLNTGFAVGQNGTFLKTLNGGSTWQSIGLNIYNSLYQIFFIGETGWVVGTNGIIIKTTDAGATWLNLYSGTMASFFSVYFLNLQTGWASGQSGTIMKTTNGGETWMDAGSCSCFQWLQSIKFLNESTGISAGGNGSIILTTNGGYSWASITSGTTEHLEDLSFPTASLGFAVGDHGTVMRSTNGGINWQLEVHVTNYWLNGVYFFNENKGWAVGNNGTIIKYQAQ